jgi:PAS domain S-box-containing protein
MLIVMTAVLPIAIAAGVHLLLDYREHYDDAKLALQVAAETMAQKHSAQVDGIKSELVAISQFPEVRMKEWAACTRLLKNILKQDPVSHNIGIADISGNVVASAVGGGFSISDRKYFKDAVRTKRFSAGEYTVSRTVSKPSIHFALPVLDAAGAVIAVVYVTYDLDGFSSIFEAQKLPRNSVMNVTDHRGVFLYRYPANPVVKPGVEDRPDLRARMTGLQSEGVFVEIGRDNVKRVLGFKRLQLHKDEQPYVYIRVSTPEDEIIAGFKRYFIITSTILILATLIALFAVTLLTRRFIITPFERFNVVARSFRDGNMTERTGIAHSEAEIGMLAKSFDDMAESIEARESALCSSEQKYSNVFELSPITMALTTYPEGRFTEVNREFTATFGYSREEALGQTTVKLDLWVNPDERSRYLQIIQGEKYVTAFEAVMRTKQGELITVEFTGALVEISGQKFVLHTVNNITERRMIANRENDRLKILEKIASGTELQVLLDAITRFVESNLDGALCSLLLANESGTNLLHGSAPSLPDSYNHAVHGLKIGPGIGSCGTAAYQRTRVVVEDIEVHPYWKGFKPAREAGLRACWSEPILSSDRQILGTFATYYKIPRLPSQKEIDLMESAANLASIAIERMRSEENQDKLESQIHHMQKIEAIGQLTGGIAHDFNNLLTPIFVYAGMIKNSLADTDPNVKKVDGLIFSANKAKELTQKLLSFSRKQILAMDFLDLNEMIQVFYELLRSTVRENISLDLQLSNNAAIVMADRGQLEQILLNLVVNAQDAIEGGGTIRIQTGHVVLDDEFVRHHPGMKTGAHVSLAVSDDGCGMTEDIQNHIFEPFYTTKEVGHGTGLGLSTVYGIVKQHDGYLQVKSHPGEGTTFTVYFPEQSGALKPAAVPEQSVVQGVQSESHKSILIVDDNLMILEMAVSVLESAGYRVHSADNPEKAMDIACSRTDSFDLLVTDIVMPHMNGPELYGRLAERDPNLSILYISGYTDDVKFHNEYKNHDVNFLAKPFTAEQFLDSIKHALSQGPKQGGA